MTNKYCQNTGSSCHTQQPCPLPAHNTSTPTYCSHPATHIRYGILFIRPTYSFVPPRLKRLFTTWTHSVGVRGHGMWGCSPLFFVSLLSLSPSVDLVEENITVLYWSWKSGILYLYIFLLQCKCRVYKPNVKPSPNTPQFCSHALILIPLNQKEFVSSQLNTCPGNERHKHLNWTVQHWKRKEYSSGRKSAMVKR